MKKMLGRVLGVLCAASLLTGCGGVGEITPKDVREDASVTRIMTFNVCGWDYKNIQNLVPKLMLEYDADVIGTQECTYDWYKKFQKEMPEYSFIGVGRDTGKLDKDAGEMCGILYKTEKYTVVDSGTFWLSETPDTPSQGWDGDYIRICTWAVLKDNATNYEFAVLNSHLENIDDGTGHVALQKGAELVKDKIVSFDVPVILLGDLNFEKETEIHTMFDNAGLADAQDVAASTMDGITCPFERGGDVGEHIDYVFLDEEITNVLTYKILRDSYDGKYPSDHYALYVDVKFQ